VPLSNDIQKISSRNINITPNIISQKPLLKQSQLFCILGGHVGNRSRIYEIRIGRSSKSLRCGEVPIGAVLVFQNQIISSAYNQVESLKDATAHAEMLCLKQAAEKLDNWRLLDCTLYCTLEPCLMCAGAMILSRVKTLVWGAPDLRHGAGGSLYERLRYRPSDP
jgi:tRNA(Arg) A34 adenosine deaminase TadA